MTLLLYENKTFKFTGKLTIYKVTELKNKIIEFYNAEQVKEGDFFLDFSSAEVIDASVLQLLISLKILIKNGNGNLKLKVSSQIFDTVLEVFSIPVDTFPKAA